MHINLKMVRVLSKRVPARVGGANPPSGAGRPMLALFASWHVGCNVLAVNNGTCYRHMGPCHAVPSHRPSRQSMNVEKAGPHCAKRGDCIRRNEQSTANGWAPNTHGHIANQVRYVISPSISKGVMTWHKESLTISP